MVGQCAGLAPHQLLCADDTPGHGHQTLAQDQEPCQGAVSTYSGLEE